MSATVLLVEDELDLLDEFASYLEGRGYRVRLAMDGTEALTILEAGGVDLVVTDDLMPEMTGLELIAVLRAEPRWQHLPVILASAYDPSVTSGIAVDRFLHKPFELAELGDAIEAALARAART